MSAKSKREFAPHNHVNNDTRMLNVRAKGGSPMVRTTVKSESQSSPARFDAGDCKRNDHVTSDATEGASLSSRSPRLKLLLTPRRNAEPVSSTQQVTTRDHVAATGPYARSDSSSAPSSPSSGLKIRLRGIQAALKEPLHSTDSRASQPKGSYNGKRTSSEACLDDEFDTDSEIDIMPSRKNIMKPMVKRRNKSTGSRRSKKANTACDGSGFEDDDVVLNAGDEDSSSTSPDSKLILSTNMLKRSERILDPSNPEHAKLIAATIKAGPEYYDSDMDDLPGNVKETNKPHLFRNVRWGSLATDYSNPAVFTMEPEFTQFVPGRFERLPDGTASDQKAKLIIKLTDKQHRQRVFLKPPPRDWNNQEAITALNKRTVQQIRRNTSIRFREVVEPYVKEEREWILAHLTEGKPTSGWKKFVVDFNQKFEGRKLEEGGAVRPERSHSSLTKEVERFGKMYSKGVVPKTTVQGEGKRKARKAM